MNFHFLHLQEKFIVDKFEKNSIVFIQIFVYPLKI